jgi:U4/U6.U5 tri-snRNP-associated protein 3
MAHMMGFSSFDTTKNKHVDGNAQGETKLNRPRKYRQYMNRRGGFNRPLDYIG